MKKVFMVLVCICLLTVTALAVEPSDFEYETEFGTSVINWNRYMYAAAQEKLEESGVVLDLNDYVSGSDDSFTFDNVAFEADYAAALEAMENSVKSGAVDNVVSDSNQSANDSASDDKYPLGSYIDEMGRVYSPTGELLSSGTEAPSYLDAVGPILDDVLDISDEVETSNELSESRVYQVVDMRSGVSALSASDDGVEPSESDSSGVLSGLKDLIISIFGEYTPVMTTSTVTETVDNVTTTTLIDTVASGAAGVDYAWIAGVFLFGILFFCLMKLLGGILK